MNARMVMVMAAVLLAGGALAAAGTAGVVNPYVKTDRAPDFRTIDSLIKSVVKDGQTHEQKVLAVFHVIRRNFVHGPTPRKLAYDFHRVQHSLGTGACLSMTTPLQVVYERMGYKCQSWVHNGHHMMEVFYDDAWHCLDPHMTFYCYDRSTSRKIASLEQLRADPTLAHDAVKESRACPGYLLCGDAPKWFAAQKGNPRDRWQLERGGRWPKMIVEEPFGNITLRRGESYTRTWRPGRYFFKAGWLERDGCGPVHHCGRSDRKDSANWPLFEPHGASPPVGKHTKRTFYKIYGSGRLEYRPSLEKGRYRDAVAREMNIASAGEGPAALLRQADTSKPGEIVFSVHCPYVLTAGELIVDESPAGKLSAAVSVDGGKTWKPVTPGKPFVDEINGSWTGYRLKLTLTGGAIVRGLALTSHFQLNRYSLPYLAPGKNVISVSAEEYGSPLTVKYEWADGADWKTDTSAERTFKANGDLKIKVAGPKHPRMKSLTLSVAP